MLHILVISVISRFAMTVLVIAVLALPQNKIPYSNPEILIPLIIVLLPDSSIPVFCVVAGINSTSSPG